VAYREVSVIEVREVLRVWLDSDHGLRRVAELAGVDRKTARRYVEAAQALGVVREGGLGQLDDALVGAVVEAVRPARPAGHGAAWQMCQAEHEPCHSSCTSTRRAEPSRPDAPTRRHKITPSQRPLRRRAGGSGLSPHNAECGGQRR
jgi:hypothetical protein